MSRIITLSLILTAPALLDTAHAQQIDATGNTPNAQLQTLPQVAQTTPATSQSVPQVANLPTQPGQPGTRPPMGMPPFQLGQVEQQFVDQILHEWENESAKVKIFKCDFERWEYDPVFGPGNQIPSTKSEGQLNYSKPDKGSFKITQIQRWQKNDPQQEGWEPGDWVLQKDEVGEHWVCDGKSVFEFRHDKKQLVVQPLPPDMQGTAIVDGPLPFLFGAEAEKLKRRYWIRSKLSNETSIYLEAFPRWQADAANYHHVDVMLDRKRMLPTAIQVHMPNGQSRAVYMFKEPTINGKLDAIFNSLFSAPRTPLGWKRVVEEIPSGPQGQQLPSSQAAAPQETTQR